MGRNADKRKARRDDGPDTIVEARPSEPTPTRTTTVVWAERALPRPVEVPVEDAGLARVLFRLTAQLAVRDTGSSRPRFDAASAIVADAMQADVVSLLWCTPERGAAYTHLQLLGSFGLAVGDVGLVQFDIGDGLAGAAASSGELIHVDDAARDPRFVRLYGQRTEIGSMLAVPLVLSGVTVGVMALSRREIRAFSQADCARATLVAASVAQDIEQTQQVHHAMTDPLTGLASRFGLLWALPREVEIARRYHSALSLLLFDVDGLAAINGLDRSQGDALLRSAGRALQRSLRAADWVVRLGGDEFAVLLPMTPSNQAKSIARRLVRAIEVGAAADAAPKAAWSVGVATLATGTDETAFDFLTRADQALLDAKEQGGGTIVAASSERS
jgi:diguanylate cyclase (GGDEF)-like protein